MKHRILVTVACMFALATWLSPLHADSGPTKKKLGVSYVWEAQIGDEMQLSTNSLSTDDGASLAYLIDGDKSTIFHSIWSTQMADASTTEEKWVTTLASLSGGINSDPGYHNLQVELSEPVSQFKFQFYGRDNDWHDNPTDIEIFATNDPALGSSVKSVESSQWTKITELTQENANLPGDVRVVDTPYESPVIEMPEAYKYIRFVVKNTCLANFKADGTRNFAVPDITGITFNLSEFQIYAPREVTSPSELLSALVDSITTALPDYQFSYGTDPGYTDSIMYENMFKIYSDASESLVDGSGEDVHEQYITKLRTALYDFLENGVHQVESGYYTFTCGYPAFYNIQKVTKSLCVNTDKEFGWATTDTLDATQLWKITKLENGNYSMQNAATGEFVGSVDGNGELVPMTATHEVDQLFTWDKSHAGSFGLGNVKNSRSYDTQGHSSGAGISGRMQTWVYSYGACSSWYIHKVTNQELLDKLVNNASHALTVKSLKLAIDSANTSRDKANEYNKLITDASQISSNAQSTGDGSSYANLIDGYTSTIFHSVWDGSYASPVEPGTGTGWHNLQFALNQSVSKIKFNFTGRENSDGWTDTPNHITLYATNDETLGASTAAADSTQWTQIVDMTDDEYNFPNNVSGATYSSPIIDLGGEYKYLRFVVKHTTTMDPGNNRASSFIQPSETGVTFNLSEMQIYDGVPSAKSQYYTVEGMKEACDALDAAIAEAQSKANSGVATEADIAALQTAYRLVDTLYIDRASIYASLTSLLETANDSYNKAIGARLALITDVEQLNTNSVQTSQGTLEGMIDGDKNTIFHSIWDTSMAESTTTKESWEEIVRSYEPSYGSGYHNLNVNLATPVKSFFFEYYSRNSDWHDNPTDIEIYATNDAALYDDVRASTSDQWTKITELTEGFPTNVATDLPYTSPQIDLGSEYKYIRFVVKNTCMANNKADGTRDFAVPDITGITWNVSEFQMYTGLDPESVQYNYIEEVHTAADELKTVIDKYSSYAQSDIASIEPVTELQAAIKKLQTAYVDTTELVEMYKDYKSQIALSEEGSGIGYVDSQSAIDALDAVLDEARALVSPTQPTRAQVSEATEKINTAYAEFMTHVGQIEPYVWYNIKSSSTREALADQPIYLGSTSTGDYLHLGNYPGDAFLDVYAIWRFVPIEGKEGQYAIQSLGTGQYFGSYRGIGGSNRPLMSHEKSAYELFYYGLGSFKLHQVGNGDKADCLKTDASTNSVLNWKSASSHQQAWHFEKVEDETDMVNINWYPANNTGIVTLPWATKGEQAIGILNDNVETYAINNIVSVLGDTDEESATTLTLTKKDEFEAGEPFILVTTAEPDENGQQPLTFGLPGATADAITDTSAIVSNGLVGTLEGTTIKGAASLYFSSSVLRICNDASVTIGGRYGYIDFRLVTDQQGSTDKTITINGTLNNIKNAKVVEDNTSIVNVYTIDGVLLKQNVKASEALKNLTKGIYIVGKKKVLVK